MARFVMKSGEPKPQLYAAEDILSEFGKEVAQDYATKWMKQGVRDLQLERDFPELAELLYEIRVDPELCKEHAEPALAGITSGIAKSNVFVYVVPLERLNKAQIFIGPRGGKWADAKHTIAWKPTEGAQQGAPQGQELVPGGRKWMSHFPGLPEDTQKAYMVSQHQVPGEPWPTTTYTPERTQLHQKLINSFTGHVKSVPENERKVAFVMMGGPASGKSTIVRSLLGKNSEKFVNVNPDDVKEMLPEYKKATEDRNRTAKDAAWMVHEESSDVAEQVYKHAVANNMNIVFDGTGKSAERHQARIQELQKAGYHVKVIMPDIDMGQAIKQSVKRAEKNGRWVPLGLAIDAHQRIPGNFERIAKTADSFMLFDRRKNPPALVWEKGDDGRETVHDAKFVATFKERGRRMQEANKNRRAPAPSALAPSHEPATKPEELPFGKSEKKLSITSDDLKQAITENYARIVAEDDAQPARFANEPFEQGAGIVMPMDDDSPGD